MRLWTGSEVEASNVMGKGFPLDKCPPRAVPNAAHLRDWVGHQPDQVPH